MEPWIGWTLATLVVCALLAFVWFGLSRWSEIMRRHRANEEKAQADAVVAQPARKKTRRRGAPIAWIAVQASDARSVARCLGVRTAQPCDWESGLDRAADGLFVAACRGSHVCAIGEDAWQKGELSAVESALERLSREFGSASWFCIDAERGRFGWAFAHSGSLQRAWCGDGDDERVLWQFGERTAPEAALGFFVDDPRDRTDDEHKWWPIADDVRALAVRCAVLPEPDEGGGFGVAGRW
jgi:hypothetical protein